MAFFNERHCRKCGKTTTHNHSDCMTCQERDRQEAERDWMAMSLDERLLDLRRRLIALERGPVRYG